MHTKPPKWHTGLSCALFSSTLYKVHARGPTWTKRDLCATFTLDDRVHAAGKTHQNLISGAHTPPENGESWVKRRRLRAAASQEAGEGATLISTRLFIRRPDSVALEATGELSP